MARFYKPPGLSPEEVLLDLKKKSEEVFDIKPFGVFSKKAAEEPSEKEEQEAIKEIREGQPEEMTS